MITDIENLLTLDEVCSILKVSDQTVKREIKELRLAATRVRSELRFTKSAVEDYIRSRTMKIKKSVA